MIRVCFILGCTAVGKGAVARAVAKRIGAQIVSVDSMKVYRRMDIGTGKPTAAMRAEVAHHCMDIVEPSESFSVARYVQSADRAIAEIAAAGEMPLAVGGTALYVKGLSEGLFDGPGSDRRLRASLKQRIAEQGLAALHAELAKVDPEAASRIHPNDEKRIVRAMEVFMLSGEPISRLQKQWDRPARRYDCFFLGLRRSKADAAGRINARVKRMIERGLRDEVASLLAEPAGLSRQAIQALGYAEMIDHIEGRLPLADAVEKIKVNTRRLAKRQRTWFRRFADVRWIDVAQDDDVETTAGVAAGFIEEGSR